MTDDELRKLAEAALSDKAACADGNWEPHWDGTLGRSSVFVKPPEGGPCLAQVIIMRRGHGGIAPEGHWIAAARTREPELARAVLRLLEERDELARYKAAVKEQLRELASGPNGIIFAAVDDAIDRRFAKAKP